MLIKALELSDLEKEDTHQHHYHQKEGVDSPLHQILHLHSDPYSERQELVRMENCANVLLHERKPLQEKHVLRYMMVFDCFIMISGRKRVLFWVTEVLENTPGLLKACKISLMFGSTANFTTQSLIQPEYFQWCSNRN